MGISPGRLAYYREAELKHGRVCMSSTLGILVAEKYHPLFGGEVDVPAVGMLKSVELTYFRPALLALAGGVELVAGFKRIQFKRTTGAKGGPHSRRKRIRTARYLWHVFRGG